jgi:hypothetical protein
LEKLPAFSKFGFPGEVSGIALGSRMWRSRLQAFEKIHGNKITSDRLRVSANRDVGNFCCVVFADARFAFSKRRLQSDPFLLLRDRKSDKAPAESGDLS